MKKITALRHLLITALFVSCVVLGSFVVPKTTLALFLEGGRSQEASFCSCSVCFKIEVGSPKSGTFMYCPWFTRLYAHYNIFPNAWQLGKAYTYMTCLQISYPYCRTDGGGYLLTMTGTSHGGF
ncbi:TPA: hypothetical protein DEP58_00580 [Patescibacteria group bacterium]|nr:hypothetical protein [Patescibacteria group bacterium]